MERNRIAAGVGGHIALEFANTAGWHLSAAPSERLISGEAVLGWATEMSLLRTGAAQDYSVSQDELAKLVGLREDIFSLGRCLAMGAGLDSDVLERVQAAAAGLPPEVRIAYGRLIWHFRRKHFAEQLQSFLAQQALAFFCSPLAEKIRLCEGEACGWLFVDDSRSGRRRWCSMTDCGSRAKARRHYQRAKSARAA